MQLVLPQPQKERPDPARARSRSFRWTPHARECQERFSRFCPEDVWEEGSACAPIGERGTSADSDACRAAGLWPDRAGSSNAGCGIDGVGGIDRPRVVRQDRGEPCGFARNGRFRWISLPGTASPWSRRRCAPWAKATRRRAMSLSLPVHRVAITRSLASASAYPATR
jgi:hypothetical protein